MFHHPRSILFAIGEAVGKELDRLEQEGSVEKVEFTPRVSANTPRRGSPTVFDNKHPTVIVPVTEITFWCSTS